MSIIITLILISLVVALGFLSAFFWATKHGQFEDGYTPSVRILFDDAPKKVQEETDPNPTKSILPADSQAIPTFSSISTNE